MRGRAEPGLPDLPKLGLAGRVVEERDLGALDGVEQPARLLVGFLTSLRAELDHQESPAARQLFAGFFVEVLQPFVVEQPVVDAFERDRFVRQNVRHRVGGGRDVRVAQHDHRAFRQHRHQFQFRAQDGDQRRFAADEQSGDVETVFGQQRVEVVARHPARDVREPAADLVGVFVAQPAQLPVDRGAPVAVVLDLGVLVVARFAAPEPGSVRQQHFEPHDVVHDLAGALRGRAAGVVADHAAESAVHVRGGLGTEPQPGVRELPVEVVQHDSRLHDASAVVGIHRFQLGAVLRPVEHHSGVGALAREARPAASRKHRRTEFPRYGQRFDAVVRGARHDDTDGDLAEIGRVGGVGGAAAVVEADLALDPLAQGGRECLGVDFGRFRHANHGIGKFGGAHRPSLTAYSAAASACRRSPCPAVDIDGATRPPLGSRPP